MGHEGAKYGDDGRPTCDCLHFDLDDTLYPVGSGIGLDVMNNILQEYMVDRLANRNFSFPPLHRKRSPIESAVSARNVHPIIRVV
ncbi:uncharacterized protein LOC123402528 isoform X4 [Hordeum vulgare subsp. vulgare]|uniref:uncharacterized protein LOC123402528 isoform X4 n=1 Tax=Hordeum vulgare subsp. vulgare TaxID=112509 RepID=UPI00162C7FCA|nr:uncharacterized protein LOC123402528 isoform X4 [Hordeum vulgare subsp. vulgare]